MKTRLAAAVAALLIGVAAPASSALAYYGAPYSAAMPGPDVAYTGSIGAPLSRFESRTPGFCPISSAAEGNAAQQNFPVQQYGQTTGGNRC